MGRIRTIKPEMPQSESMGNVSREARLLFILLWTLVDDDGRTRAASRMLSSVLYPYDKDQAKLPALIDSWLEELEKEGCLHRYKVKGSAYLEIVNWRKHQKIDKPSKSRLPSPEVAEPSDGLGDVSANSSEESTTDMDLGKDQYQGEEGDHSALVERVFEFYCQELGRDPKKYTLTDQRRKKAELRVRERFKVHGYTLEPVKAELAKVIRNLAASDYHVTNGYIDWTDQIFKSPEEFEKRLNWTKPETGNGTHQSKTESSIDAAKRAIEAIENRHAAREVEREASGSLVPH